MFSHETPLLRDDPIAHPIPRTAGPARGVSSNVRGPILTRISARFGDATREVSQNGNRIRIKNRIWNLSKQAHKACRRITLRLAWLASAGRDDAATTVSLNIDPKNFTDLETAKTSRPGGPYLDNPASALEA